MITGRETAPSGAAEPLHAGALSLAAMALLGGLTTSRPLWVNAGVSMILLLPPLRLATTILAEARARRLGVALMGVTILAFVLFSRRIS
jgi:hypothetical protein